MKSKFTLKLTSSYCFNTKGKQFQCEETYLFLFIYIHYFERVNTFSYAAILPCGPLSTNIQAFIQAYTWNTQNMVHLKS